MVDMQALCSTLDQQRAELSRFEQDAWRVSRRVAGQIRSRWSRRIHTLEQALRDAGFEVVPEIEPPEVPLERLLEPVPTPAPKRTAVVVLREGEADERAVALAEDVVRVGRGRHVDLKLRDDPNVSRVHCRLERVGEGRWEVEDLRSANGTLVNGELFTGTRRPLYGGEELIVGGTFLRFRLLD